MASAREATWGAYVRKLRLKAGYGLRRFATLLGYRPSNYCNLETGKQRPPKDRQRLTEIADALGLAQGTAEWKRFFDLAARALDEPLPADVQEYARDRKVIPVLLRTTEGKKLSDAEILRLVDYINEHF